MYAGNNNKDKIIKKTTEKDKNVQKVAQGLGSHEISVIMCSQIYSHYSNTNRMNEIYAEKGVG